MGPTPAPRRQPALDSTPRCYYAEDPVARPHCALAAVVRYGPVPLCRACAQARSTLGKGVQPVPLRTGHQVFDTLAWISAAHHNRQAADRQLHAAVTRARTQGHTWTAIAARLGTTRQAAQQRFGQDPPAGA